MEKIVITFDTTSHAMAMEFFAKDKNFPGKLMPIPNKLSAGCGLAWEIEDNKIDYTKKTLVENNVTFEKVYLLDF